MASRQAQIIVVDRLSCSKTSAHYPGAGRTQLVQYQSSSLFSVMAYSTRGHLAGGGRVCKSELDVSCTRGLDPVDALSPCPRP
jgi:hypothetical protein